MTLTFLGLPLIPAWTVILKPMQLQSLPWHAAVSREARRALMRMTLVSNPPSPQQLQPPHSKAPPLQLSHLHLQRLHLQGVVRELRSSMQRLCWFPPPPAAPVPPPPPPPAGEADLPRTITYFLPGSRHNSKITWYKGTRNIEISCRNPEHGASSCRLTRTTKAYSGKGGGHMLQGRPLGFAVAWLQGGCEADGGSELHLSFEPSREDRRIARQTLKESAQGRLLLSTERAKFDGEDSEPDM